LWKAAVPVAIRLVGYLGVDLRLTCKEWRWKALCVEKADSVDTAQAVDCARLLGAEVDSKRAVLALFQTLASIPLREIGGSCVWQVAGKRRNQGLSTKLYQTCSKAESIPPADSQSGGDLQPNSPLVALCADMVETWWECPFPALLLQFVCLMDEHYAESWMRRFESEMYGILMRRCTIHFGKYIFTLERLILTTVLDLF